MTAAVPVAPISGSSGDPGMVSGRLSGACSFTVTLASVSSTSEVWVMPGYVS